MVDSFDREIGRRARIREKKEKWKDKNV